MDQEVMIDQMTAQMKMEVVADAIAAFQSVLEKAYMAYGVRYVAVMGQVVTNYSQQLLMANGLIEIQEDVVS